MPRRECDLAAVAAAALSEVRPVADGHRLTLADGGPVPVDGNPDELHRLAVNLLDNGLRHTPAGTEIRVAVERRNGDAVLEVSDDGPGIPPGMEDAGVLAVRSRRRPRRRRRRQRHRARPRDREGGGEIPWRRRRRGLLAGRRGAVHGAPAVARPRELIGL